MKTLGAVLAAAVVLAGCGDAPVAGDMTAKNVCQTAGYLIRQQLGSGFRTNQEPCDVQSQGGGYVEIESGYVSPLGPTLRYTARGSVSGRTLTLTEIRVHGVRDEFIPFLELGGR